MKNLKTMKRTLFLMLFLAVLGATSVNAQVTIGSNQPPHPGAVLDLQSKDKGLKLPVVEIQDANKFQLSNDKAGAMGMVVYNKYSSMIDGNGPGIYVWGGDKWNFISSTMGTTNPVTQIVVTSKIEQMNSGDKVQFTAAVYPKNPTNPNYSWSVVPNPGTGTVDESGMFTAGNPGLVRVRATAQDGSGVYGEKEITIIQPVKKITLTAGLKEMNFNDTVQINLSIEPENATNKEIEWVATGPVTINSTGLVIGNGAGTASIKAIALDGSKIVSNTYEIKLNKIIQEETTVTGSKGVVYRVFCYPGAVGCWMVDNSREGMPTMAEYKEKDREPKKIGERGYYYSVQAALIADSSTCPEGYHLPTEAEWDALEAYLENAPTKERKYWVDNSTKAGYYYSSTASSMYWDTSSGWWEAKGKHFFVDDDDIDGVRTTGGAVPLFSIRCVKKF